MPNEKEWVIIVNRSTSQWGHESTYTKEVEAQEVGRGKAPVQKLSKPVETFTIVPHPARARCSISTSIGRPPGSWCPSRLQAESQRARASRATPASSRSTSSAVVYAAHPARTRPPRAASPYRRTTLVA